VLCVQPEKKGYLYGVFKLEDSTFIAAWKGHHKHADTLEELKHLLNGHEKMLLTFKVQE
jgi:hypothetical protein